MIFKRIFVVFALLSVCSRSLKADDGYRLWLKYDGIENAAYRNLCLDQVKAAVIVGESATIRTARDELMAGLKGLLGSDIPLGAAKDAIRPGTIVAGKLRDLKKIMPLNDLVVSGTEGYLIKTLSSNSGSFTAIVTNEDSGVLYGVYHFLRLIQTRQSLGSLNINSSPKIKWRMLNHWDNLDGSVERGYAGKSIWKWNELPDRIDPCYRDYARANASVGINGVVLNNVNATAGILSSSYLKKVAALAGVFRPYGIHVFLSANFAAPKILGDLLTAAPGDPRVQKWWKDKSDEIYQLIPDFGGFLVKANSEGQPGPQDYHRTHAEGANMMADALSSHGGILIWRAFVYSMKKNTDRAKAAYDEFKPLDGSFRKNVLLQVKNGPLDFQPREPFSPLLGAMPRTSQMLEFQITQEYTGFSTALVYLGTLFKEGLESDTYVNGKGSTVGKVTDGSLQGEILTGIAGVANTGNIKNWTRHPFAQANWYALGRLAWDHTLSAEQIADEWIRMTLTNDPLAIPPVRKMMMSSREWMVDYSSPLGLTVLSAGGHHYGPQPWKRTYYHRADSLGIGFDRTETGSNAVNQYASVVSRHFSDIHTCPETFLAWFHHVPWDHKMKSGRTFWEELCYKYYKGVEGVRQMQKDWAALRGRIDPETFDTTGQLLKLQEDEAVWWRDACLGYFGKISGRIIPPRYEKPRYNQHEIEEKDKKNAGIGVTSVASEY